VPLMPAPEERPLPLARAQERLAFDDLLRRRQAAIVDAVPTPATDDLSVVERDAPQQAREVAALLEALARRFADAVDRGNDGRQYLRQPPIEYVDAVVLSGDAGDLLVEGVEYEASPVYWQAKAGDPDSAIRGRDLDGYLRTGDARYAEQLGLPS
jgi:hypothetical protein